MKYFRKRIRKLKAKAFYPWEHGNYFGPGWSAGRRTNVSLDYRLPGMSEYYPKPVDIVDRYAMYHDADYAKVYRDDFQAGRKPAGFGDKRLMRADFKFARREIGTLRPLGIIGGIAVGAQGAARGLYRYFHRR